MQNQKWISIWTTHAKVPYLDSSWTYWTELGDMRDNFYATEVLENSESGERVTHLARPFTSYELKVMATNERIYNC